MGYSIEMELVPGSFSTFYQGDLGTRSSASLGYYAKSFAPSVVLCKSIKLGY